MTQGAGDQLVLEHVVAAPRARVWEAFTEPALFAQWFGPVGWSVDPSTVAIDLRVGGLQSFSMHDDTFPSVMSSVTARFVEIVPGERLVSTETVFGSGATDSLGITLTIELSDEGDETLVRLTQGPFPEGVDDLAHDGWIASFGKLEAVLA